MASSYAIHTARMHVEQQRRLEKQQQSLEESFVCTCGAQAFRDQRTQERQRLHKRVTPANQELLKPTHDHALSTEKRQAQWMEDPVDPVTRKRSLWRKLLGKGPKCICAQRQLEREALRPKPIAIPSEYQGCVTVRVAGKQVAYTREMQLIKRRSYTPMDAISEDED